MYPRQATDARINLNDGTCTPNPIRVGGSSPWGTIQHVTELADGIVSVSTAGHGGIWITSERERQIPANVRAIARQYAPANWYEEDCDACIPMAWFADELIATQADAVAYSMKYINVDPRMAPVRIALERRTK